MHLAHLSILDALQSLRTAETGLSSARPHDACVNTGKTACEIGGEAEWRSVRP
jgi:hypothetical protein